MARAEHSPSICRLTTGLPASHAAGFSLIEMLVALAVFGLAALALLNLAGETTRSAVIIEESLLAGVVADNRAVEALIATPAELQGPDAGVEVAGDRRWRWVRKIHPVEDTTLLRIDIAVMPARGDRVAAEAHVFRGRP